MGLPWRKWRLLCLLLLLVVPISTGAGLDYGSKRVPSAVSLDNYTAYEKFQQRELAVLLATLNPPWGHSSARMVQALLQSRGVGTVQVTTSHAGFADWMRQVLGDDLRLGAAASRHLFDRTSPPAHPGLRGVLVFFDHPSVPYFPEFAAVFSWDRYRHLFASLPLRCEESVEVWGQGRALQKGGQQRRPAWFHLLHVFPPSKTVLQGVSALLGVSKPGEGSSTLEEVVTVGVHVRLKWMEILKSKLRTQDVFDCVLSTAGYLRKSDMLKPVRFYLASDSGALVADWVPAIKEYMQRQQAQQEGVSTIGRVVGVVVLNDTSQRSHTGRAGADGSLESVFVDFYALGRCDYYVGTGGTWDDFLPFMGSEPNNPVLFNQRQGGIVRRSEREGWCLDSGVVVQENLNLKNNHCG